MINKFSKLHNSIFTKIVLTITALSFMSLFGVSNYISTANSNKAVIKVDDIVITQSEFNYMLQRELAKIKAASGEDTDENDERKNEVIATLAKAKLEDALIENTMKKYNIDFTDTLVRNIIFSTPQFLNNGEFDREAYKWFLNRSGLTEKELIADIKRNVGRKILLDSQVAYTNVPAVLQQQMEKVLGQRRTFRYIKLVNNQAQIDREPTEDELNQFYDDLGEEFTVPEKRDVTMMYISNEDIEKSIEVSEEEINAYYKEHIDEFEHPEQRYVLQMIFDSNEKALEAKDKLAQGADFIALAAEYGQKPEDVDFGYVARDELAENLSDVAFSLNNGQVSDPIEVEDTWQLLKVKDIKAEDKTPRAEADALIMAELKQEKAYDGNYELISKIEDKLGAGTTLEEIANSYNTKLLNVNGVAEDGTATQVSPEIATVLQNQDVIETIFSYNEGEVSQTIETDNGLVVVQVQKINEAHIPERELIYADLRKVWIENERASITQEKIDNIEHDLEVGDSLYDVAKRYGMPVMNTMPVTRSENFDKLTYAEMKNLFSQPKDYPVILHIGDDFVVAETSNIYDDTASLTKDERQFLAQALYAETSYEMAEALLQAFAKNYKVEVNYNRMGLND